MPTNRITISATTSAAVLASRKMPIARSNRVPQRRMSPGSSTTAHAPGLGDEGCELAVVTLVVLVEGGMTAVIVVRHDRALDRGGGHLGGGGQDQCVAAAMRDQGRHRDG